MQIERELIVELRALLAEIHGDKGQHSVDVGLVQSTKEAREKVKNAVDHWNWVNNKQIARDF